MEKLPKNADLGERLGAALDRVRHLLTDMLPHEHGQPNAPRNVEDALSRLDDTVRDKND